MATSDVINERVGELDPSRRVLLGPGPSDVSDRVLRAMAMPTIGHLDPEYLVIMNETCDLLRAVFQTENELTLAVSGTGSAGMEACVCNLIEPGDEMIVCINGVFGGRMQDVAERCGAVVHTMEVPWGEIFEPSAIADMLAKHPKTKAVGFVNAETSTGAYQPIPEISKVVHDAGALVLVDAVTSLAGMDLRIDEWGVDACYSGTQKCLSCPPGLAPVTFSPAAAKVIDERRSKVQSWYLDMTMVRRYWGDERFYHHTAPINMTYALREALRIVVEEGLADRVARHALNHRALRAGLEAMGLRYIPESSLTTLNAISIPDAVEDAVVRGRLLKEFGIEIGGGLGPFKGKAWRIGLMGTASTERNVILVLSALSSVLGSIGAKVDTDAALPAAMGVFGAG